MAGVVEWVQIRIAGGHLGLSEESIDFVVYQEHQALEDLDIG